MSSGVPASLPRPEPRRLILQVASPAVLHRRLVKAKDATISIPELADEASPLPWGWTIAGPDRFRDLRCSVRDLLLKAALDLEDGVPAWMRDMPEIKAQICAVRDLLEDGRKFTVVIHDSVHWGTSGGVGTGSDEELEGEGTELVKQSCFEEGSGNVREVFGDPGETPLSLPSLDLDGVAAFILSGSCRSVVLLTGAGISTASGIPDYRGSGGMWKTIAPERLTATEAQRMRISREPEWVANIELFQDNPLPLLELKRSFVQGLAQGLWRPTLAHFFVWLLHDHGLLTRVVTQNIDGLHQAAGVPDGSITEIHGSIRKAECTHCGHQLPLQEFADALARHIKDVSTGGENDPTAPAESRRGGLPCPRGCQDGLVRPKTVLFGEPVNPAFQDVFRDELPKADLLIVAGTSVTVAPACKAPVHVGPSCVRLVINDRRVGEKAGLVFDRPEARRDIMAEGDIDRMLLALADKLGWLPQLQAHKAQMAHASAALL